MSQPQRIVLTYGGHLDGLWQDVFDAAKYGLFAFLIQPMLQLKVCVKVVFNCFLPAAGNQNNFGHACGNSLAYHVLDDRPVVNREQFFGNRLGCRQHACAQPGHWNHCFRDLLNHS